MNQIQIIGAIMAATGLKVPDFAKKHGRAPKSLYRVINGEQKGAGIRALISETIQKPISEIWPEEEAGEEAA